MQNPDPSKLSSRFAGLQEKYQLVDALFGGTASMRAAGKRFLTRNPREEELDWEHRLGMSVLYNAYRRSLLQANARLFAKDIDIKGYPAEVGIWSQDADAQGRDLTQFTKTEFLDALNRGVSYILVEFPKRDVQPETLADALASGDRPYWVPIQATQVLAAHSKLINGAERLTHFRFKETVLEVSADYLEETLIEQIKAFYQDAADLPVTWQTWRYDKTKGWYSFDAGVVEGQMAIPVAPIYTGRTGFFVGEPPMLDLAYLNVTHWQSTSEQRNILHVARVPFLHINGWEDKVTVDEVTGEQVTTEAEVNIYKALITNTDNARAGWVETSGAGLSAGVVDLKDLEQKMDAMGLTLSAPRSGNITATENSISAAESNSLLKEMARGLEDSLELALAFTCNYLNVQAPGGKVTVSTDFAVDLDTPEATKDQ